jgi:hypothetical protein
VRGNGLGVADVCWNVRIITGKFLGANAAAIKSAILGSTIPTTSLSGRCVTGGRLNVGGS